MGRRGSSYVLALTVIVNLLGAAGIHAFERESANGAITGYGSALWLTALTLATMGADCFPLTPEGANDGFAVFGYVTVFIANFFLATDAEEGEGELAGTAQIGALRDAVATLSRRVEALLWQQRGKYPDPLPDHRSIPPNS